MKLLIRADASARMGTGHVMRCLSLAQGWRQAGQEAFFLMKETTPALEQRLQSEGFDIARLDATAGDAAETARFAREHNAGWVIADGYHFDAGFQQAIKTAGLRLLLVDDYGHASHYSADYVLNQNLQAKADFYAQREPHTRLLLGTRYALLRRQFNEWRGWKREFPAAARRVLVTLGGSDPDNVTGRVIGELTQIAGLEVRVLIGGSNPHRYHLQTEIRNSKSEINFIVDAPNMPALMAWADAAIAAGGTTSWELAFMGLPSLVLVLADNQRAVADALAAAAVARKTTPATVATDLAALLADTDGRAHMSRRGREAVDGDGVSRVTASLRATELMVRRVRREDCQLIWEWANDPDARAASFSSGAIPWETHLQWFASQLESPACLFYIASYEQQKRVGQIRYDVTGTEAIVSVSLAREARGQGLGAALIVRGSQQCFADSEVELIRAYTKPDNEASAQAFQKASFTDAGRVEVRGHAARQFVLRREEA
jgi:UDP-2,4-diacetamido-2,4,6-trideoxy-beta-L-altropyranose hydrolase